MSILTTRNVIELFNCPEKAKKLSLKQWSQFIFVLRECDLLARFYHFSFEGQCFNDYPEQAQHHLISAKIQAERQAKQANYEAYELHHALQEINVTPIFLKGAAYTLRDSIAAKGRIYADMDILVSKSELIEIERKLSFLGWFAKELDDYDQQYYRKWAHEIPPLQQISRGTVADIHHNLLPPISGRAPNIDLFTHNLCKTDNGFFTLDKPAMVLHSIIHLFFNEEFQHGFRDLTDLHLLFSEENEQSSFWTNILELSISTSFQLELFCAVRYCQSITKTSFPKDFLAQVNKIKVNPINLFIADFIFTEVLTPMHPILRKRFTSLAVVCALVRGHLLKMPIHILIYHSLHKFFKASLDKIFVKKTITPNNLN
jgi:hypothetical protein